MAQPSVSLWSGRPSRSCWLEMDGADAASAYQGFTKKLRHMPVLLRQTLIYDQVNVMAEHKRLAQRLTIRVFFATPHSPQQHWTYENTNGLLRQYIPKGTDSPSYTQRDLNAIAHGSIPSHESV